MDHDSQPQTGCWWELGVVCMFTCMFLSCSASDFRSDISQTESPKRLRDHLSLLGCESLLPLALGSVILALGSALHRYHYRYSRELFGLKLGHATADNDNEESYRHDTRFQPGRMAPSVQRQPHCLLPSTVVVPQ